LLIITIYLGTQLEISARKINTLDDSDDVKEARINLIRDSSTLGSFIATRFQELAERTNDQVKTEAIYSLSPCLGQFPFSPQEIVQQV
jgi:hypothetical protein